MAMNPLYDPSFKGSSDFGPKAEAWWPKADGDKIRGTITFVGKPWDKPKNPKFYKDTDPEYKKFQKTQKIVISSGGTDYAIYISGRLFKKLGEAMAEHDMNDFGESAIGWDLGYKWQGFYVDGEGKPQKDQSFKLFAPDSK